MIANVPKGLKTLERQLEAVTKDKKIKREQQREVLLLLLHHVKYKERN